MLRYLKAAFFYSPNIPGFGRIPWNLLALGCFAILGFGNLGFWLLGASLEATYLLAMSSNKRFQRLCDTEDTTAVEEDMARQRENLINQLSVAARKKLAVLQEKRTRIKQLYSATGDDAYLLKENNSALSNLSWLYLKLLVSQNLLQSAEGRAAEESVKEKIAELEKELLAENISPQLRQSKTATLKILQKRLDIMGRREESLHEIESDLTRIEAQMDLALENAQMQGRPQAISANIDLASTVLDSGVYGESESVIAELEDKFRRVRSAQRAPA
jgi:hypothetical protein